MKLHFYTFSRDRQLQNDWTSLVLLTVLLLFTALLGVFLFGMPFWSWFFNDYMGQGAILCTADPYTIVCQNGANYVELAKALGRYTADGELWACGCEEGVLSDWACPINKGARFSLSLFISTAPATGTMAALSSWPVAAMWLYGSGTMKTNQTPIRLSLIAFQFFYGLFLVNTCCIYPEIHHKVVDCFLISEAVHYFLVAMSLGCCNSRAAGIILTLGISGFVVTVLGMLVDSQVITYGVSDWLHNHAFWLGECCGLMATFAIAPVLLLFQEEEDQELESGNQALATAPMLE